MTVIVPKQLLLNAPTDIVTNDSQLMAWTLTQGDAGARWKIGSYTDKSVQFTGTFDELDTVSFRGSNLVAPEPETPADWFPLSDAACGTALSNVTEAGGAAIMEATLWVSPLIDDGGGASTITFTLFANKRN